MPGTEGSRTPVSLDAAYTAVEEAAKQTYIRALKLLPPDVKDALSRARAAETDPSGQSFLDIMLENLAVAERDENLVCQDTGTVVYWLEIGEDCPLNLARVSAAVKNGTERATLEHPLRPNAVHPVTRANTMTNTGRHLPAMHYEFVAGRNGLPADLIAKEKEIYADQIKGKPANIADKILEGKLKDFFGRVCLVDQKFVKDDKKTVGDVITEQIHKMGENIYVKRFARLEVGG